ncbi:dihydrofolate reductase [Marivirga sp. S37H4]|uniref:Dihydrofolate reductase n=1 Tax=Marivirga aurantiaca TaxID=2802615 RepID=A0A934X0J9_9BACT|nr:dihydrofolate reductase family protein [Marivirga aurantiaca]MBK6266205.1 dihydrofolate reductase [Marivirga aurantiaca]
MRKIIYYIATSVDGFISGQDGDVSGFLFEGSGVNQYINDLKSFDTVIMGRKTYEAGYQFGLKPGQAPYPQMNHYIFSSQLVLDNPDEKVSVCKPDIELIKELKKVKGTDIYLCGGGDFAGWLLEAELIDILKIKLNPLLLGNGVRLFGNSSKKYALKALEGKKYDYGLQILTYEIKY